MMTPILPTYSRTPLAFDHGKGAWLFTADGTPYLDLAAGIAVNVLGHAHPALVGALCDQAAKLWHVSNLYEIPHQTRLAERLVAATFADTVFFTNSGTEAAELAIKMVRKYWSDQGQPERVTILTFDGAFHGRSTGAIAAAGSAKMTAGFGPLMPGFKVLPFGDHEALRAALTPDVAAVMIEPLQGEGGIRRVPNVCLQGLRAACTQTGALLVLDEVQCGMGRTGRLFAHEWAGITPDIMMVAKGIGGGFPLGAVLATEQAASGMTAGTHGSTYGGNPLACAVGAAVMGIVADPAFLAEVQARGAQLRAGLEQLVIDHPAVFEDVRGMGFMLGLKCKLPNADVVRALIAQHVLTVPGGDNVVRLLPALTLTEEEIAEALCRIAAGAISLEQQG